MLLTGSSRVLRTDRWHSALGVAEALVDWDRVTEPEGWRTAGRDDVAAVMVLLARVLARRDQRDPDRFPRLAGICHPNDLVDLALGDVLADLADAGLRAAVAGSAVELDVPVTGLPVEEADRLAEAAVPLPMPMPRGEWPANGVDDYGVAVHLAV